MKIGADKVVHFLAGALIALVTLLVTKSGPWSIATATIAGACKEWWDSRGYGTVEFADFIATVAGGIMAVGSVELYVYIIGGLG